MLKRGKQRELIKKEKDKLNLSWNQLSKLLDLKHGRLKPYYYEKLLIPEEIFNKLSVKKEYKRFILERKKDNWGKSKGGINSADGLTKKINIPKDSIKLAELYGIMLGDGNLNKTKAYKIATYQARITGDSRLDKEYLFSYVKPLIEKLFKISVGFYKSKDKNAINLIIYGRRLVEFFESKGFKPGNKINNQLIIPRWIKQNANFLKSCLRGLYDTDGGAYKLNNQNTYQIAFTNHNPYLLSNVRESLISLGISPSKIIDKRRIYITKKSELRKFLKQIGFRNSRHLNKIKMWNIAS